MKYVQEERQKTGINFGFNYYVCSFVKKYNIRMVVADTGAIIPPCLKIKEELEAPVPEDRIFIIEP